MTTFKRKLIEVALPLEAINAASAREKNPFTKGHPRALHPWWARRPLAACRAVLFASLVDDPSAHPDRFPTEEAQEKERQRLFSIIEQLVPWESSGNDVVLKAARQEVLKSTDGKPPQVLDPFCGGGSIPLEAQRLGLEAHASDLNPVAVLITKALIEIPPRFAGQAPANPEACGGSLGMDTWKGTQGLAEDVRYYGRWMRDEAEKRIGHLYPKVKVPREHGGGEATVMAWLWVRTIKCPNPACGAQMPLVRSFWLSKKKGKQAWVEPLVDRAARTVRFDVRTGDGTAPGGTKDRRGARCLFCGTASIDNAALRELSLRGGIGNQLFAVVAEADRGRLYLPPEAVEAVASERPSAPWLEQLLCGDPRWFSPPGYGLTTFADLFTPRQLTTLTTLSDLVGEARERVRADAVAAGLPDDCVSLEENGSGATAYADALATYLAIALSRLADFSNAICSWDAGNTNMRQLFARQAIPMAWDFAETNPLRGVVSILDATEWAGSALASLTSGTPAHVRQLDATAQLDELQNSAISTDPPYYDNIGYADLSDFFYVWLRHSLGEVYPQLTSTLLVPKTQELVAAPYRFDGDRAEAQAFFEAGLGAAFVRMREAQHPDYPLTLYYAFKQAESNEASGTDGRALASTGWETMLEGLLGAGFAITGTWPMRTEQQQRSVAIGTNALASSVVLVCRPRAQNAPLATRKEFISALKEELPKALRTLQQGNIAPVDLAQAAIGPGMTVFSRYSKVVEADGLPMRVRTALALINQALDEVLAEQESEFDAKTRWALAWFDQHGHEEGPFGAAETLSRAKNTSVQGMVEAGILASRAGKVRLLRRDELPEDWDPTTDMRLTVWEFTQYLIRALERDGERGAAQLQGKARGLGEIARDLGYRLYTTCERKKLAQDALAYNSLVVAWPEIMRLASGAQAGPEQTQMEV